MGLVDIKDSFVDFWYDNKIFRQVAKIGGCILVVGTIAIPAFMNTSKSLNDCRSNNHAANMCPNAISLLETGKGIDGLTHQYNHLLKMQGVKQENGDVISDVNIQLESKYYTLPEGYEDYTLEGDKALKIETIKDDTLQPSDETTNTFFSFDEQGNPILVKIINAEEHIVSPFISYLLTDKDGLVYQCTFIYYDGNYYQSKTLKSQKINKENDITLVKRLKSNER